MNIKNWSKGTEQINKVGEEIVMGKLDIQTSEDLTRKLKVGRSAWLWRSEIKEFWLMKGFGVCLIQNAERYGDSQENWRSGLEESSTMKS